MEILREIKIKHGLRKEMIEIFQTSYPTLRQALQFQMNTDKAEEMRSYALEHGGVMMTSIRDDGVESVG